MNTRQLMRKTLRFGLASAIALAANARALPTDLAQQPLAQPASNVPPNIMLILDDSGSMIQQYTPDYLGRHFGGSNKLCFDSLDDGSSTAIEDDLDNCEAGDPPLMSPDVNTQYYNPEIRYYPAANYDGSSKGDMNAAATNNWTEVPTDGVSVSSLNTFRKDTRDMNGSGATVSTSDLVNGYPDRAWCKSSSDLPTDATNCRVNSAYSYPDATFGHGKSGSSILYRDGAPYYYRLLTTEYCTDRGLKNCTNSTVPTGAYIFPAPVRYCSDVGLTDCQGKYQGSYTRPKFTGIATTTGGSNTTATATITVKSPQSDTAAGQIDSITVNGVPVIGTAIMQGANFTPADAASAIASAIMAYTSSPNYTASATSNVVTITAQTVGPDFNGYPVTVDSPVTSSTPASLTFTVSNSGKNWSVSGMTVSGTGLNDVNLIASTVGCPSSPNCSDDTMAAALAAAINGGGSGFSASASGSTVTTPWNWMATDMVP